MTTEIKIVKERRKGGNSFAVSALVAHSEINMIAIGNNDSSTLEISAAASVLS